MVRQHSGLELEACFAPAGCVQRLLEKTVGFGEVSRGRSRQTLTKTREHEPVWDCRPGGKATDLVGVPVRGELIVAKPGKFNGDEVRDEETQRISAYVKLHDIEEFDEVLERHGAYHPALRQFLKKFQENVEAKKAKATEEDRD